MLQRAGGGAGLLGLATLLQDEKLLSSAQAAMPEALNPLAPKPPHFAPKAKTRHLALHERRAESRRHVGLQARTRKARRPGAARLRQESPASSPMPSAR